MTENKQQAAIAVASWISCVGALTVIQSRVLLRSRKMIALSGEQVVLRAQISEGSHDWRSLSVNPPASVLDSGDENKKRSRPPRQKLTKRLRPRFNHLIAGTSEVIDEHDGILRFEVLPEQISFVDEQFIKARAIQSVGDA